MHARERIIASAVLLFVTGVSVAWSQGADLLFSVSTKPVLTLGDAAALVGIAGGSLPPQIEPQAAVDELKRIGFTLPNDPADAPISIGQYSYLVMQLLDLRGGFLYSLFPGPRYALRELIARGVLNDTAHQGQLLAGTEGLRILGMLVRRVE